MAQQPLGQLGRFALRRLIGEGGMGSVYEAIDEQTGATVAIKTFRRLGSQHVLALKNEFRALADLHHGNLVRLGELHRAGDQWFFTMELVSGRDLLSYVRGLDEGDRFASHTVSKPPRVDAETLELVEPLADDVFAADVDELRLRRAFGQLAQALVALHRAGIVHRDIKPSNVLVDATGRVVLLDFGVSTWPGARDRSGRVAGTLAYMAPEQTESVDVGPAADFYAFGCVLFEALCGRLPFAGNAADVLRAKHIGPPPLGSSTGSRSELLALAHALMAPNPALRPTPEHVLEVLGQRRERAPHPPPFIGRHVEHATVASWFAREHGGVSILAVEGAPGIGKSAFVHEALRRRRATGAEELVLRGRCFDQESLPFNAWDGLVDALQSHLLDIEATQRASLLPVDKAALASSFPVLRSVPEIRAQAPLDTSKTLAPLVDRAADAVASLLVALSARVRLVLVIDDVQWADAASVKLVQTLAGRVDARVRVLLVGRSIPAPLRETLGASNAVFELAPLSEEDASALARSALPAKSTPGNVALLCREALGHPLHLLELCWYAGHEHAPHAPLLLDSFARRIDELEPRAREMVEVCALSRAPLPLDVLAAASSLDESAARRELNRLAAAHMLRVVGHGAVRAVDLYHERVRDACLSRLTGLGGERRIADLRARLGKSQLERLSSSALDLALPAIARHLDAGLTGDAVLAERMLVSDTYERAATVLLRAGAFASAEAALRRALELLPNGLEHRERRLALQIAWMEARALSGDEAGAMAVQAAALETARTREERARVHEARAMLLIQARRHEEALAESRTGMHALGVELASKPSLPALLARGVSVAFKLRGVDLAALPRSEDLAVDRAQSLLATVVPPAFVTGRARLGVLAHLDIVERTLDHGASEASAFGVAGLAMALSGMFSAHRAAHRFARAAQRLDDASRGDLIGTQVDMMCGAFVYPWVQPFGDARAVLERALESSRRAGDRVHFGFVATNLAVNLLLEGGDLRRTGEELERLASSAADLGDPSSAACIRCASGALAFLCTDDPRITPQTYAQRADVELEAALGSELPPTFLYFHSYAKALALYLTGNDDEAARSLRASEPHKGAAFALPLLVDHALLRALIANARCDEGLRAALDARLQTARASIALARSAELCPDNFGGRRRLIRAEAARLAGLKPRALTHYRAAADHAEARGHRVLAAVAWTRAASLGPRRRDRAGAGRMASRGCGARRERVQAHSRLSG